MKPIESHEEIRTRILAAATPLFAEKGYRGVTIRELCRATGMNVASVHYYFGSKETLYHAVFERLFEDLGRPLHKLPSTVTNAVTWERALETWVRTTLRFSVSDEAPACWAMRLMMRERTDPSSVCQMIMAKFFKPLQDSLVNLIAMGLPSGQPHIEAVVRAMPVLALCEVYSNRPPPWPTLLFPDGLSPVEWADRMARHHLGQLRAELRYRGPPSGGKHPRRRS